MARRRSYRGTPDEHLSVAQALVTQAREAAEKTRNALSRGSCSDAFRHLERLFVTSTAYSHEAYWSPVKQKGRAVERASSSLARKFQKKCVKR